MRMQWNFLSEPESFSKRLLGVNTEVIQFGGGVELVKLHLFSRLYFNR